MTEFTLTTFIQDWQFWAERYLVQGLNTPATYNLQLARHWQTQAELLGFPDLAALAAQVTDPVRTASEQAQAFQQLLMNMHLLKRLTVAQQLAAYSETAQDALD
ncbi:hypothetical protein [Photobacterium sp. 1_MG-2023]|uniref:hypothetical protein n=1 Tax=Photobacterium sp. 1_MG-2023 TaxID=3062646 RepID=UPI0026E46CE4|nr:hypothetical protein [Photobacterium sp. 1_MG-2023]MDO6708116.1 hypothetical protein [Photobacterium sp. 1_MG-2023]